MAMVADFTHLGADCPRRHLSAITHVLVHRIEDGETAEEVAKFFKENPEWTGGKMPYHIVIPKDGRIQQACAFDRKAPGAVAANPIGIQVALVGDFRVHGPTAAQEAALLDVCIDLSEWIGFEKAVICGHTDYPGASLDPKKICPGPMLNLKHITDLVGNWACSMGKDIARKHLETYGYVFERK